MMVRHSNLNWGPIDYIRARRTNPEIFPLSSSLINSHSKRSERPPLGNVPEVQVSKTSLLWRHLQRRSFGSLRITVNWLAALATLHNHGGQSTGLRKN